MKKILSLTVLLFAAAMVFAQHATGDNTSPEEFERILKTADRATRDFTNLPPSFTLKKYTPVPQNQDPYGTCVAWSSAYAARTISYAIKRNMTNADSIKKYAFSPGYLYYKVKAADDVNCSAGASILTAMEVMTGKGAMLKNEGLVDCAVSIAEKAELQKAGPYKIKTFLSLVKKMDSITKNEIIKIKKSLTEKKPVVISMKIDDMFQTVPMSGTWSPETDFVKIANHAMCIIGYDDKVGGGSFEVMNSWGTKWGNKGFFWLSYKQVMKYGNYAVEMMDYQPGKAEISGDIEFVKLVNDSDVSLPVSRSKINTQNVVVQGKEKAEYSLYKLAENLNSGDRFKMKFSTNAPSFIYVFAEDEKPKISRLFPPNPAISAAINSPAATYYFPSDSTHAKLDNTAGKENFCILYSKSEIDFEGLMNYIKETKVSIFQGVKDKLGPRLLDIRKVKFREDRINFQAPADDKSVLCFFVEMKHN